MDETAELRTERLVLRRWRPEDRSPFAELNADPRVMEYFASALTTAESNAMVDRIEARFDEHGYGLWAVEVPGVAPFVGFVGLAMQGAEFPFGPAIEVGWRLAHASWGLGYATEGARAALRCGSETFGITEFVSMTSKLNLPSQRVMRRVGMTHHARDDFEHPNLPAGHRLRPHVLFRLSVTVSRPTEPARAMVTTTGSDPVLIVAVGEFDFDSSERLRAALMTAAQEFTGTVVVDLSGTEFLDSIAIGVLLQAWQRLRSADRELVIRSPNARIRRVLQVAAIEEVVRIEH
jgi:anti-anti-sigma factor